MTMVQESRQHTMLGVCGPTPAEQSMLPCMVVNIKDSNQFLMLLCCGKLSRLTFFQVDADITQKGLDGFL